MSPWVMIEVTLTGDVRMCGCGSWMPSTIGNLRHQTLESMLSSSLAVEIRQSIVDGTYHYCNEKLCGVITNESLNTIDNIPPKVKSLFDDTTQFVFPHHISFQGDRTCNLSCPSCRHQVIKTPDHLLDSQREIGKLVAKNLFSVPSSEKIVLELSGTGEFFASELLMSFVTVIDRTQYPHLKFHIGTNGLLAESRWHKIAKLESAIEKITVSIDAANALTYEKLRRGGKWENLLSAMKFLQNKKHHKGLILHTRMIVQRDNYQEMADFYDFCKSFDVDVVEYSRITNWGTFTPKEFADIDVFDTCHSQHQQAKAALGKVRKLSDTWLGGL